MLNTGELLIVRGVGATEFNVPLIVKIKSETSTVLGLRSERACGATCLCPSSWLAVHDLATIPQSPWEIKSPRAIGIVHTQKT